MMTVRKKIIKGKEPRVDPNPHHNHQLLLSHHRLAMCQVAAQLSLFHPLHPCRWNSEGQQNSKPSASHIHTPNREGEDVTQAPFPALVSSMCVVQVRLKMTSNNLPNSCRSPYC
ncbi:hypothetical protein ILYODFUR_036270 [Ilyodon furcidens]|uniref:Uncharacterized protein n=1 Tax=Ilyodon furcidens TaxID=33524 RepID=A0ABV0SS09_9TELE